MAFKIEEVVEEKPTKRSRRGNVAASEADEVTSAEKPKRSRKTQREHAEAKTPRKSRVKKEEVVITDDEGIAEEIPSATVKETPAPAPKKNGTLFKITKSIAKEIVEEIVPKHYQIIARYSGIQLPKVTLDNLKCVVYECDARSPEEALAEFKSMLIEGNGFTTDREIQELLRCLFGETILVQQVTEGVESKYECKNQTI